LTFLSPYNDRNVWLGQTYNLESAREDISRALGGLNPSQVVVPVGGGFACGVGQLAKLIYPGVRITGIEPGSHAKFSSLEPPRSHSELLQSPGGTIADGTATKAYGDKTFAELSRTVDWFESVSEDAIRDSIAFMYAAKGIVAEGAGALGIAMIMQVASRSKPRLFDPQSSPSLESVLTFVSGKNINPDVLDGILRERGIVASGA